MRTTFRSSQRRSHLIAWLASWIIDFLIVFVAANLVGQGANAFWWALLLPLAVYVADVALSLYRFLKRMAFFMFEREQRIKNVLAALQNDGYPPPESQYEDVDEYLRQAIMESADPEVRLSAGLTLGSLASQRIFGPRAEAVCTSIVIETAIRRMPAANR